jgi:hypothetical protein
MGKQLSLYLDEHDARRLAEISMRECRRPSEQARYLLRQVLMQRYNEGQPQMQPTNENSAGVRQDLASAAPR